MGIAIRNNQKIEGISFGEAGQIKSGQFVDDLWTSLKAKSSAVNAVLQELENFKEFSGLVTNPEKCAILRIGPWRDSEAKFYTMKHLFWSPDSIRILGIKVYPSPTIMYHDNYIKTLEKMDNIINSWEHRNLTILGKITVVNSLINTIFLHIMLALPSPPECFFKLY